MPLKIAIVGVGGTGSFAAQFLSKTNHELLLIDGDVVEESNLSRQNLFTKSDVFKFKAVQAKKLLKNNRAKAIPNHLTTENAHSLLKNADFIIDCTDNWLARMSINQYCLETNKTWVYSGAIGTEAMVSTIGKSPCFACFAEEKPVESCSQANTTPQTTAAAAAIATSELLNLIEGRPRLSGKLFYLDTKTFATAIKPLKAKANCFACVQHKKLEKRFSAMCGGKDFLFFNPPRKKLPGDKKGDVTILKQGKHELILFKDGRTVVKGLDYKKALEANELAQRRLE